MKSDQTLETQSEKGEKGHKKKEAPWRLPTRRKCVNELMYQAPLGHEKLQKKEEKMQQKWNRHVVSDGVLCVRLKIGVPQGVIIPICMTTYKFILKFLCISYKLMHLWVCVFMPIFLQSAAPFI